MDISFKKYKKSSTYYRKLKLASEKYRFMFNKLHVKRNTARNPVLSAAIKKATVAGQGLTTSSGTLATNTEPAFVSLPSIPSNPMPDNSVPEIPGQLQHSTAVADNSNGILLEEQRVDLHCESSSLGSGKSREALRLWSLRHNINHNAIKDLLGVLKDNYNDTCLPSDPRTLLETPPNIGQLCYEIPGGKYWHHGLVTCIEKWFENLSSDLSISININIDGLPIHKSSKFQLWPILCNVFEMPELTPLPIGIFLGKTKPTDLNAFLTPFVNEAIPLIQNGVPVNGHTVMVKIRCFICDSPARAFVKGMITDKQT
ncbi:uncharacterized protein LOC134291131 [Aedes albopictus]|uniref:Uncharacterized protein n=1 Tax=Aedes albopictus TaxID=7160 RepID=A0ABM1ZHF3_AEDAL